MEGLEDGGLMRVGEDESRGLESGGFGSGELEEFGGWGEAPKLEYGTKFLPFV